MGLFTRKKYLPKPTGKFATACADLMTKYSQYGVFIRLYYPTRMSNVPQAEDHVPWKPHDMYIKGLACVIRLWVFILRLVMWWYGGQMHIPAVWGTPLLSPSHRGKRKLPVVIFSHGFGAARFFSSAILSELASHGYVVASVEHRDTSACATYYYKSPADRDKDQKTWIPHTRLKIGPEHFEFRRKQIRCRRDECIKALDFLKKIDNGNGSGNVLKTHLDLKSFKDQLDFDNVTIMGHSFGGATALMTLAQDKRFKQGVILDGWMFPLKGEDLVVPQPLVFINSPTFHIPSNVTVMQDQFISRPHQAIRHLYIIKTSNHESQTDAPFVFGYWLDLFQKKIEPSLGTAINNLLILRFLQPYSRIPQDIDQIESKLKKNEHLIVEGRLPDPVRPRRGMLPFS